VQGAFREHALALADLGGVPVEVRTPAELAGIDALVLPGGESTTMSLLLQSSGLFDALAERLRAGLPTLATCAGLILLADDVRDAHPDQRSFGLLGVSLLRNGYGRQRDSFETELSVEGIEGGPFPGVFIRAPRVLSVGPAVEVLARVGDDPVLVRQGPLLASAFHPELSGDLRLHRMFLDRV